MYLPACGVGKAILANFPRERVSDVVEEYGLPAWTENTITDEESLYEELNRIRNRGVAFDDEERIRGLQYVAAPIQCDGELLGAISVSGPKKRFADEGFGKNSRNSGGARRGSSRSTRSTGERPSPTGNAEFRRGGREITGLRA